MALGIVQASSIALTLLAGIGPSARYSPAGFKLVVPLLAQFDGKAVDTIYGVA